jgi:hypothetical protein
MFTEAVGRAASLSAAERDVRRHDASGRNRASQKPFENTGLSHNRPYLSPRLKTTALKLTQRRRSANGQIDRRRGIWGYWRFPCKLLK